MLSTVWENVSQNDINGKPTPFFIIITYLSTAKVKSIFDVIFLNIYFENKTVAQKSFVNKGEKGRDNVYFDCNKKRNDIR